MVVLLAAGRSSRTSGLKQLYRVNGEYLINHQISRLCSYGFEVAVVLGHQSEEIKAAMPGNVITIYNENHEEGMFFSVKKAFEIITAEYLIFCHIDRPIADKEVFEKLEHSGSEVAVARYKGKRGPPIRISRQCYPLLLDSPFHQLDHWIIAQQDLAYMDVDDPKILQNANTDETLRRYFD